jgi:3-methyladenine DNA glycosylase AlkD
MTEEIPQTVQEILEKLKREGSQKDVKGMAKVGITTKQVFGVRIPVLRSLAKKIGTNHQLALNLWQIDSRETRILAGMVADPKQTTDTLLENWALDFNYWEIVDQTIMNLIEKLPSAYEKALAWTKREEEFVKRAGYVIIARLAVSDKKAVDERFEAFLPIIEQGVTDDRTMVKKAVNWALRQIGKRNKELHKKALVTANKILAIDNPSAQWIAKDAIKELEDKKIINRITKQ